VQVTATANSTRVHPAIPSFSSRPTTDIEFSLFSTAEPLDELIVQRTEALAEMRRAGAGMDRFNAASKREATLVLQIHRIRRQGSAS
jgi:hypothetical protein